MTDKNIIKALENLLFNRKCKIAKSGEQFITLGDIVDLINRQQAKIDYQEAEINLLKDEKTEMSVEIIRQQAEIERLTINMNAFGLGMKREKERADTIRAEAIKEFADLSITRICEQVSAPTPSESYIVEKCNQTIYNLLKEMAGEQE